jgi:hypothetical protein
MNLALAKLTALSAKLEEAEQQPDGLALVWTPATSTTSMTMYVLSGQVDGLPISLSGDDAGWFLLAPVITLRLTCKPFGYGTPLANITDDFSTNTIANYTFDSGSGTLSITGGQLVPSTTGGKEVYYSAAPYSFSDQQVTLKVVTGAAVAGSFGVILRRLNANNYLLLQHSAAQLQIVKKDGGGVHHAGYGSIRPVDRHLLLDPRASRRQHPDCRGVHVCANGRVGSRSHRYVRAFHGACRCHQVRGGHQRSGGLPVCQQRHRLPLRRLCHRAEPVALEQPDRYRLPGWRPGGCSS